VIGVGAGERALLVTEQLALDQVVGQRAAVDRDEVAAAPRQRVGGAGQHLLAGAAVALDQDRHRRAGDLAQPGQVAAVLGDQRGQAGDRLAAAPRDR
jgi:hypothetical protein